MFGHHPVAHSNMSKQVGQGMQLIKSAAVKFSCNCVMINTNVFLKFEY